MQANRQSRYRQAAQVVVDAAYIPDADATRKYWLIAGCIAVSMLVGAGVGLVIMNSVGGSFVRQSGTWTQIEIFTVNKIDLLKKI